MIYFEIDILTCRTSTTNYYLMVSYWIIIYLSCKSSHSLNCISSEKYLNYPRHGFPAIKCLEGQNNLKLHTSFGQFCVASIHVWSGGGGRSFPGIQSDDFVLLPEVEGHEEAATDAHAVRVDYAVAEEGGDGRIHHSAVPSEHVSVNR